MRGYVIPSVGRGYGYMWVWVGVCPSDTPAHTHTPGVGMGWGISWGMLRLGTPNKRPNGLSRFSSLSLSYQINL